MARFGAQSVCAWGRSLSQRTGWFCPEGFSCLVNTGRVGFLLVLVVGLPLVEGERSPTAHFRHPLTSQPLHTVHQLGPCTFRFCFVVSRGRLYLRSSFGGFVVGPSVWARRFLALLLPLLAGVAFGRAASACGLLCCCFLVRVTWVLGGRWHCGRLWLKCRRRT